MRFVLLLARVLIGGLFVWAAVTKLHDLPTFGTEIANYRLLPNGVVPWLAAALPGIEIVAGLLCLVGLWTRVAAGIVSAMLLVFIVAISQALVRHIQLHCGCFGGVDEATWSTVWRDVGMLAPAWLVVWRGAGAWALEGVLSRLRQPERVV
jgi:putative oxidoreductase